MAKYKLLFFSCFLLLAVSFFISCGNDTLKILPEATGRSGDLLVVLDTVYQSHQTGNAIMEAFATEQFGLPQREPLFNVIMVPHKAFSSILLTSRNIIAIHIKNGTEASFSLQYDTWSKKQLVMNIFAPDDFSAAQIISKNAVYIRQQITNMEYTRIQEKFARIPATKAKAAFQALGIDLHIPTGFDVSLNKDGFVSARQDKRVGEHIITQCISAWHFPYSSDSTFTLPYLLQQRDSVTRLHLHSLASNAYMEVYKEMEPRCEEINLNGLYAMEMRGLWSMVNDFMGGPFVCYTFVDEKNARVYMVDVYVFAPKFDKREYLRELEAIARSASFVEK